MHSNSPPISSQSDTLQEKIFSCDDNDDDDDMESSLTLDIQSLHPIQGVSNDVALFCNVTEKFRKACISMSMDYF